ncbi:MAG: relaxase/mobilization nuclease domain-containing protein [Oscillospiraceae bacterium]|nr:relaxase/mobilization nuclease domain-containing protein [Oscillospiraceae bacterium]
MPYVKQISVHKHPLKMIRYILNGDKNSEMKYSSGLNCTPDIKLSCQELSEVFEKFTGERFYKSSLNDADKQALKKQKVRLHHYIQSFAPGEATPEEAHRIGVKWAKKVFGDKHQVIISTHIDKGHLHNHFAVAAYNLEGKAWHSNIRTLKLCREISDKLALEHGLSIIKNPKRNASYKYGEWLARKNGTSWKVKLCEDIDHLILQDNVKSVDDLVGELRKNGYEVKQGKYISVKAPKQKHAIRTFRLGDGYDIQDLQYRISNKNEEMPLSEAIKYEGIQREYALCLRQLQITVYRNIENPVHVGYSDLRNSAELLSFLCNNNIHSVEDFESLVNSAADTAAELRQKKKSIEDEITQIQQICGPAEKFVELNSKATLSPQEIKTLLELKKTLPSDISSLDDVMKYRVRLEALKSQLGETSEQLEAVNIQKREYGRYYSYFIQQAQSDYDFIREQIKREQEEIKRAEQLKLLQEQGEQSRHINKWVK